MNKLILETKNLTKKFNKFEAVKNVNIHISENFIFGIHGITYHMLFQ